MLIAKRPAGVAPEMNLRNPLHVQMMKQAREQGIHTVFETLGQMSSEVRNRGYQWPHKKD